MSRAPTLTDDVLEALIRDGAAAFDRITGDTDGRYQNLILADARGAREALLDLRSRGRTFLELGSGLGIITIVADLLGYDAYGIEIEPRLVDEACRLAEAFGSTATFVEGSFVPPDFQEDVHHLGADFFTVTSGADAYEEMGMTIGDFDIVYFETEPGDVILHHLNILHYASGNRTASRRRAIALRYSGDDAVYVKRKFGPPPLYDPGLESGAPLDSDLFPVVRAAPAATA